VTWDEESESESTLAKPDVFCGLLAFVSSTELIKNPVCQARKFGGFSEVLNREAYFEEGNWPTYHLKGLYSEHRFSSKSSRWFCYAKSVSMVKL
jgi:hypothetical protein